VIIPHRNQPRELRRCLESLQRQTVDRAKVEIIVVDNASRDLPTKLCEQFLVRLVQEHEPGPGPARNKGVSISSTDILAFTDADCMAIPNWLSTIIDLFQNTDVQIAGGNVRIAYENPAKLTMFEAFESIYAFRQEEYIGRLGFSVTANMAVRRSVFNAVGPFKGIEIAEDRDWGKRATKMGFVIRYVPELVVFHPARTSMDHLHAKLERQVQQAYAEIAPGFLGCIYWIVLAIAVAASPLWDVRRIYLSERITRWRDRILASKLLIKLRIYRAVSMLVMLSSRKPKRIYWDLEL
jgi:cellulose synthase/poly-beta-1,6-N-acetylglucosamine synthase-like glycosyltransferase